MAFKIKYKSSVIKDLKSLSKDETKKIVNQIEIVLIKDARNFPALKGEYKGLRKFRIGNYRVIFSLSGNDVTILKIGHRKDVYK